MARSFVKKITYFYSQTDATSEPVLEVGIGGHWIFEPEMFTQEYKDFLGLFPKYVHRDARVSSYESWIY